MKEITFSYDETCQHQFPADTLKCKTCGLNYHIFCVIQEKTND